MKLNHYIFTTILLILFLSLETPWDFYPLSSLLIITTKIKILLLILNFLVCFRVLILSGVWAAIDFHLHKEWASQSILVFVVGIARELEYTLTEKQFLFFKDSLIIFTQIIIVYQKHPNIDITDLDNVRIFAKFLIRTFNLRGNFDLYMLYVENAIIGVKNSLTEGSSLAAANILVFQLEELKREFYED